MSAANVVIGLLPIIGVAYVNDDAGMTGGIRTLRVIQGK